MALRTNSTIEAQSRVGGPSWWTRPPMSMVNAGLNGRLSTTIPYRVRITISWPD